MNGLLLGLSVRWLILFTAFVTLEARAQLRPWPRNTGLDYRLGGGVRSYPFGSAVTADVGHGTKLWGDEQDAFRYGYVRPSVLLSSAALINAADLRVSVFPVSFLGATVGRSLSHRAISDSTGRVDCERIECGGGLESDYVLADIVLGAAGVFVASQLEWREIRPGRSRYPFWEDEFAIIGRRGGDRLFSATWTAGMAWSELWGLKAFFVAAGGRRTDMQGSGGFSERVSLLLGHTVGRWRFLYVGGVYRSPTDPLGPAFGIALEWVPKPGLSLN